MSLLDEVDRALLAIGRSSNRVSSEPMRHHEEVLSQFIAAENEEDDSYATDDDYDEDYVPVDDGEVSDIDVAKVDKYVLLLSTQHYTQATETSNKYKPAAILDYNENKSGVDTMDKMLSGYSCKRATNRWPLATFYNMIDVADLASFIIYKHLRPSKKSDQRRDFLLELAEQLTIPHMERRAANPRVYGRPGIKAAMQKFNVFYDPPPTLTAPTPKTVSKPVSSQYRPLCKLCTKLDKFNRKTRFTCHICKDAMCLTHGVETKTYTCNTCLAE